MAGYASILFGRLVGADYIISMSPKTIISPSGMQDIGDPRRADALRRIQLLEPKPYYPDLRNVSNAGTGHTIIYVSQEDELDIKHAMHLSHQDNVKILMLEKVGHGLVHPLRECGELKKIIETALSSDATYDPREGLSRLQMKYNHKICICEPIECDTKINRISIPIKIENCSGTMWGEDICSNMKIFFQIIRDYDEMEILWGNQDLSNSNLDTENFICETVNIDYDNLEYGEYKVLLNIGTKKMIFHEIGYEHLTISFGIYPKIQCNTVSSRGEGSMVLQKIMEDDFGYSMWKKRITNIFHFPVSGGRLRTEIGNIISGDMVIKSGQEGFGIFGPFVTLPPGYYEGEFIFDQRTTYGNIIIDIVDVLDLQGRVFFRKELVIEKNKSPSLVFSWEMPIISNKLEVRIFCFNNFCGKIKELIIRGYE